MGVKKLTGRPPQPAARDEGMNYFHIRLPGWLKNQVIEVTKKNNTNVNGWITEVIRRGLREEWGLPEPPPAVAPLPTTADQIRLWVSGEKILTPCGKVNTCFGTQNEPYRHSGMSFCKECDIRVE